MSGAHAAFSPSSAHRVVTCPASFRACQDIPNPPSWFAVEGTIGHSIHEHVLLNGTPAKAFVGKRPQDFMEPTEMDAEEWALVPADWVVDETFAAHVQRSADWCLEIIDGTGGDPHIEQRVDISEYTPIPKQFGSCDFACVARDGTLYIIDLKMGAGVKVYAERNHQLALYALGFMEKFDWLYAFDKVLVGVSQPRMDHLDVWHTTADELRAFGYEMKERFTLALQPDAPYNPDEKACKFCAFKGQCLALAQRTQELALAMFDVIDDEIPSPAVKFDWPISGPDVARMTPEQMGLVLAHRDLVRGFLDAVEAQAMHMLLHSQDVPGYKLVEGRTHRRWAVDSAQVVEWLEARNIKPFDEPKMISPAAAEKEIKGKGAKEIKASLAALVEKPKGAPTLAPVGDKREAYTATADNMFSDVDDSEI